MNCVNSIYFDCISVRFTDFVLRDIFRSKGIAKISNIYIQYHDDPQLIYDEPNWWNQNATQSVWVEIEEYSDTENAWKFLCDLHEGTANISVSIYGDYITCFPDLNEMDTDTDIAFEEFIDELIYNDCDSELTISDSGYLTEEDDDDYTFCTKTSDTLPCSPYEIVQQDLSPFQQTLFNQLFDENIFNTENQYEFTQTKYEYNYPHLQESPIKRLRI
jgi:hypothetical protein